MANWDFCQDCNGVSGLCERHGASAPAEMFPAPPVPKLQRPPSTVEQVDHPPHYGGADNPYEAIKVIEAWGLGFNLGNAVKYLSRAGKKGEALTDLRKARWYIDRAIQQAERTGGYVG